MPRKVDFDPVEFGQAAFGEAPESLDAVDVSTAFGKGLFLIDAGVPVVTDIHQSIVAGPTIRANDALGIDPPTHDGPQGVLGAIIDDFGVNFSLAFEDAKDRWLERATSTPPGRSTSSHPAGTKVAFIDFDHATELPTLIHSLPSDKQPEALVEVVHGLTVQLQERRRLSGGEVQGKAFHHFFDSILA